MNVMMRINILTNTTHMDHMEEMEKITENMEKETQKQRIRIIIACMTQQMDGYQHQDQDSNHSCDSSDRIISAILNAPHFSDATGTQNAEKTHTTRRSRKIGWDRHICWRWTSDSAGPPRTHNWRRTSDESVVDRTRFQLDLRYRAFQCSVSNRSTTVFWPLRYVDPFHHFGSPNWMYIISHEKFRVLSNHSHDHASTSWDSNGLGFFTGWSGNFLFARSHQKQKNSHQNLEMDVRAIWIWMDMDGYGWIWTDMPDLDGYDYYFFLSIFCVLFFLFPPQSFWSNYIKSNHTRDRLHMDTFFNISKRILGFQLIDYMLN